VIDVPGPPQVPTLSATALLLLCGALAGFSLLALRRR
jgi:hypothetical protein